MSVKKVLPKHSMVIFGLFYFQEKFEKSIVLQIRSSFFKYVNTKSWNIFKVKLQGSKVKRIRPYHGCH